MARQQLRVDASGSDASGSDASGFDASGSDASGTETTRLDTRCIVASRERAVAILVALAVVAATLAAVAAPIASAQATASPGTDHAPASTTPDVELGFNRSAAEAGIPIRLVAYPDASAASIDHYEWDLGNGTTRTTTDSTLLVTYDTVGRRNVSVTVVHEDDTIATDAADLAVHDTRRPTAVATANRTNVTRNDTIQFDATASTDATGVASYRWYFPNGVTRNGSVVNASMTRLGEREVTLVVNDAHGNRAIDVVRIHAPDNVPPEIDVTLKQTEIEYGERTGFLTQSFGLGVGVDDVTYDFDGDGEYVHDTVCVGCDRIHGTWLGTRTISVRAVDDAGNVGYANATLTVVDTTAPMPAFDASTELVTTDETVTFTANATTDNHRIASYEWDLDGDDAVDATGETIDWTFDEPGERTVTLLVTDPSGNEASANATVDVQPAPTETTDTAQRDANATGAKTTAADSAGTTTSPDEGDGPTDSTPGFAVLPTVLALALAVASALASSTRRHQL